MTASISDWNFAMDNVVLDSMSSRDSCLTDIAILLSGSFSSVGGSCGKYSIRSGRFYSLSKRIGTIERSRFFGLLSRFAYSDDFLEQIVS